MIGAFFIAAMITVSAKAQSLNQAVSDSLELDRVVITASKMPQSERETTKPVQIIDRAEIEKNAGRNLSQILNQQSGIRVNDSFGAPSNGRILYLQGAAATNTLILVDGLAINDPSGTGGLFDLRLLSTENIDRIEILKGSQSTLYGTDAIAGVINIITRKGGDDLLAVTGNYHMVHLRHSAEAPGLTVHLLTELNTMLITAVRRVMDSALQKIQAAPVRLEMTVLKWIRFLGGLMCHLSQI